MKHDADNDSDRQVRQTFDKRAIYGAHPDGDRAYNKWD
jgi:hypothetical protein